MVGPLADRYGRKPLILLGLIVFLVGSIQCLTAQSYYSLFCGRLFQGIGIAAPAILSFLIIADSYPVKQQQFIFAILNGFMNAATAAAPIVGSYIALYYHWQGNLMVLFLLGVVALIMAIFFLPHYPSPEPAEPLPALPGEYISIFQSKPLLLLIIHFICQFIPYWIFVGISPLLYIKDLGVKLSHSGFYQGALALIFSLGSLGFGMIVRKYKARMLLYISTYIFLISLISIFLTILFEITHPLLITLAFIPFVIGQIIPSTLLYPVALNYLPLLKGRISAIIQGGRLIFLALCLQFVGYFYRGTFQNIGLIIMEFILMPVITLLIILKNQQVEQRLQEEE